MNTECLCLGWTSNIAIQYTYTVSSSCHFTSKHTCDERFTYATFSTDYANDFLHRRLFIQINLKRVLLFRHMKSIIFWCFSLTIFFTHNTSLSPPVYSTTIFEIVSFYTFITGFLPIHRNPMIMATYIVVN